MRAPELFSCLLLGAVLPLVPVIPPKGTVVKPKPRLAPLLVVPVNTNPPVTVAWSIAPPATNQAAVLLQGSADLKAWSDLGFFADTNGNYSYQDTNPPPYRFYRAMALGSFQTVTNLTNN